MDGDKTVRNPAKRSGLREDLKESFIVQVKSAALKQLQEGHMIPSYFESPEGRAFLEANPAVLRRELTPRARLNEEHRADKSLESLEEPQLQDEAIEAVGTCQIDQPALLESRIALSEVKRSAPIKHTKKPTRVRSDTPPSRPARLPALPEKNPLEVDVIGQPRQRKVLLPKAIKRGKPGAIPNEHFLKVDAPSRRFVANAATAGLRANTNDRELKVKLNSLGSFEAFPEKCYFGKLRNGSTYEFKLQITNTGLDSTRFSIRQPKNKCIKVFFKPGPVAPGLQANLTVELQANLVEATSKDGQIHDLFQVVSESEILTIPVEARCLEENVYDHLAPALRATVTLKDVTAPFCKADSKSK
ncbi:hypothetical protein BJ742DRAFT_131919 [Cladochytrium replicatum]|nr:hypothetical protein BJ742DRAFT_131919 [Cladochytrium replicatum]